MFRGIQYSIYALLLLCVSCAKQQQSSTTDVRCAFAADSAYSYIAQQVAFGARVPGTEEHAACGDWLVKKLAQYGAQVQSQYGSMPNYAGEEQTLRNIVAYMEGNTQAAILLCAHWDSRPWSDEEPLYENRFTPVIGANDGASGVGVILEIVRQLSIRKAKGEYIVALTGFLLLFNLISMPLATLITTAAATIVTAFMTVLCNKRCGEINSDDMTMTGYLLEFTVWATAAILIG